VDALRNFVFDPTPDFLTMIHGLRADPLPGLSSKSWNGGCPEDRWPRRGAGSIFYERVRLVFERGLILGVSFFLGLLLVMVDQSLDARFVPALRISVGLAHLFF